MVPVCISDGRSREVETSTVRPDDGDREWVEDVVAGAEGAA